MALFMSGATVTYGKSQLPDRTGVVYRQQPFQYFVSFMYNFRQTLTALFSAILLPVLSAQETVSILPVADATIDSTDVLDDIDRGNGAAPFLLVGTNQFGAANRALLRFSRGDVPSDAVVEDARLVLRAQGFVFSRLALFEIARPWTEGPSAPENKFLSAEAEEGDVTWFFPSAPARNEEGNAWQQPGGDFNPNAVLGEVVAGGDGELIVSGENFLESVKAWFANPNAHNGWILVGSEFQSNTLTCLGSRETEDEALRPYLQLTIRAPGEVELLSSTYGTLTTVAGLGADQEREDNWSPGFEGSPALDVELSRPNIACRDSNDNMVIVDTYANAVRLVDANGVLNTLIGPGLTDAGADAAGLSSPNGLYITPDDTIYILDTGNDRVAKIDSEGRLVTVFIDEEGITGGRGLWVSPDHQLVYYGSQTRLRVWRADSPASRTLVGGFERIANIDVHPETGVILMADRDSERVFSITPEGVARRVAGGSGRGEEGDPTKTQLSEPRGVAWLPNGGYLIGTEAGGKLWYVDTVGKIHLLINGRGRQNTFGGEGQTLAQLLVDQTESLGDIHAVTVSHDGDIVLTVNDAGYVRVIPKHPMPSSPSVTRQRGAAVFSWESVANVSYIVETSPDLIEWSEVTRQVGDQDRTEFIDSETVESGTRFYRVRMYP